MPSQRAILIDLEKNKLNPAFPYKHIDKSGHLAQPSTSTVTDIVIDEIKVVEPEVVAPVVEPEQIPEVVVYEEVKLEPLPVEESTVPEVQVEVEEKQVVVEEQQAPKKRGRKFNTRA